MRFLSRFFVSAVLLATVAVSVSVTVSPASAARLRASSSSGGKADLSVITWGTYLAQRVYLPGTWTATRDGNTLLFTKDATTVKLESITMDDCAYHPVRLKAEKLWKAAGGDIAKVKLKTVVLGRVAMRTFRWMEPKADGTAEDRWCMVQAGTTAVRISASGADKTLLGFLEDAFLRQLAVRRSAR